MSHTIFHVALVEYANLVLLDDDGVLQHTFSIAVRNIEHVTDTMDYFIRTAHQSLPSAGPDSLPWRMLYIDAAILKALARASRPPLNDVVARECIVSLDSAIIIAGATTDHTRRDYVVHDIIKHLQAAIPSHTPSDAVFVTTTTPIPRLSTSRKSMPTRTALPSIFAPQSHWCRAPFTIPGFADHWPAMHHPHQWASIPYLFSVSGPGRIVPVEIGHDYRSDEWSHKLYNWDLFLASLDPSSPQHQTIYLAQHSLLTQFPQLREDILVPDIVYASLDAPEYQPPPDVILNAWLGPKGTISPAHTDPFFNCYVQVVGRKTVWLAPPSVGTAMYPYPSAAEKCHNPAAGQLSNTSQVDVFLTGTVASQSAFPLFWETVPDEAYCVTLEPGDLLFFPPGWWHAMRSEDVSFSVSMWF